MNDILSYSIYGVRRCNSCGVLREMIRKFTVIDGVFAARGTSSKNNVVFGASHTSFTGVAIVKFLSTIYYVPIYFK